MASCSEIAVKETTSNKVLLKGTITGLSSGKRYCLHYFSGGWKNMPRSSIDYTYISGRTFFSLGSAGCYVPTSDITEGKQFEVRCHEVERTCESIIAQACTKILWYEVTKQQYVYFWVRDENDNPVNHAEITCGGESFYTDSDGKVIRPYDAGSKYYARCSAPTGYECTDCYESFYLDSAEFINFYMKAAEEEEPKPKPECKEGDKKPDKICVNGKWEDALCMEGTYTADRRMVCRGGVWTPVGEEPEVRKYITVEEANERVRMGLPCYIKCVLPILDLLPGLPYTPGAWVPPLCAITEEP